MNIWKKKICAIVLLTVLSVLLAFAVDGIIYLCSDHKESFAVFTDGHEAFGISGCEIADNRISITGSDPQFVVPAFEKTVSTIRIQLKKPAAQDAAVQVYYAFPGGGFSEANSISSTIPRGKTNTEISVPEGIYALFRFDFEQEVVLDGIYSEHETVQMHRYRLNLLRILSFSLLSFFWLTSMLVIIKKGKKEKGRSEKRSRCFGEVLFGNLFLSLTILFFQPLETARVARDQLAENTWAIQLLAAAGFSIILSCLMLLLPVRGRMVAASASVGTGVAFLAQCLLLNDGRPLAMNENWPMEVLNIFVWFGTVIMAMTMVASLSEEQRRLAGKLLCVTAAVLITVQAFSLTIWGTEYSAYDEENHDAMTERVTESERQADMADLMIVSMSRGLPFFLKDPFLK